jgi:hypothetical protein
MLSVKKGLCRHAGMGRVRWARLLWAVRTSLFRMRCVLWLLVLRVSRLGGRHTSVHAAIHPAVHPAVHPPVHAGVHTVVVHRGPAIVSRAVSTIWHKRVWLR